MINLSRTAQNLRFDVPKQCLCSCALYRYFRIFLCHNKMNNKMKGFMENVGFVSFVLTWPKLFQVYIEKKKLSKSTYHVKMLCNRPFHSCGLSILAFEWTWGWGLVLIQTFFLFLWKLYSKILVSIRTTWFK